MANFKPSEPDGPVNLSEHNSDYATFLPAVSGFYTEILAREMLFDEYLPEGRCPEGFTKGMQGLNFFDPVNGYYFYNKGLYSAGHAYLDIEKSKRMEPMVQCRDRDQVTVVGDSGGFQIGKGVIKFDWENFYEKEGDVGYKGDADKVRLKIVNWLEETAQWSMTLDVPTWAAKNPKMREITGLKSGDDCLKATLFNLDFFMKHKQGKTKWLNVLQGTEWEDAQEWYEAVKDYDCQGWAMGGNNIRDMKIALKRLIVLRDDDKLADRDWIHFLGTSKLDWAVMLTCIQRQIRKRYNPNITISFDCASPFIATANGLVYTENVLTAERFSYIMNSCFDDKVFKGSDIKFPFESSLGKRLTIGDICVYGHAHALIDGEQCLDVSEQEVAELQAAGVNAVWVEADLNKIKKVGKTSWDSFSYTILMAHNVEMHIRAVQRANQLAEIETATHNPNWRQWTKVKKRDKSKELSGWVPRNVLYFDSFVEELFESDDPHNLLEEATDYLKDLSNNRHFSDTANSTFSTLFDEEVGREKKDENSFDEQDPESDEVNKLDALEGQLKEST